MLYMKVRETHTNSETPNYGPFLRFSAPFIRCRKKRRLAGFRMSPSIQRMWGLLDEDC
jgi:hypothetical protein